MHVQFTSAVEQPVSLSEVKAHLRIDHDEEDSVLSTYLEAAREQAEQITGRALGERSVHLTAERGIIELPLPPLVEVQGVKVSGEPVQDYRVEPGEPARLILEHPPRGPVEVDYTAGSPVPERARQAIMELAAIFEQYRSPVVTEQRAREVPQTVERLLRLLRVHYGD